MVATEITKMATLTGIGTITRTITVETDVTSTTTEPTIVIKREKEGRTSRTEEEIIITCHLVMQINPMGRTFLEWKVEASPLALLMVAPCMMGVTVVMEGVEIEVEEDEIGATPLQRQVEDMVRPSN